MMKKILIFIFILLFTGNIYIFCQDKSNFTFEKSRLFTGGNLGLQFGTYTVIDMSPIVGYYFTNKFSAGVGLIYQYYAFKDNVYPLNNFRTNIYGAKTFIRFYIIQSIFAHGEYEALNLETQFFDPSNLRHQTPRFFVHSILLGGGYRQAIGDYSSLNLMLLYNINETIDSPYRNPIIRVGFDIGF